MKKRQSAFVVCMVCVVIAAALVHFGTRTKVPENALAVEANGQTTYVEINKLPLHAVEGEVINGKGETKQISASGISLAELLTSVNVSVNESLTVIADDEYSASLSAEEAADASRVFLLIDGEKADLIVFGDPNSKRNVSHVVRLSAE